MMIDTIKSLFLIKEKEGSVHIVVLRYLDKIADRMNGRINPAATYRRFTFMNNGGEYLFEAIGQGFGQGFVSQFNKAMGR